MKQKNLTRLAALLLALVMLLGTTPAFAAQSLREPENDPELPIEELPDEEPTDEELIEQYQIPDNWARNALLFAVRTGLMQGNSAGELRPTDNTTRAETATMLMRVMRTETAADVSAFSDLREGAWYVPWLAKAMAAGLFTGVDAAHMRPDAKITREQAFTVLARMFGVSGSDLPQIYRFSDGYLVSGWARSAMIGMIERGFVQGGSGRLKPQAYITRQELAQVLYRLLDAIETALPEQAAGSYALAADEIPAGATVEGDLLLSNEAAELTLEGVTVTGRLVIQGVGELTLTLTDCEIGELVLCRPTVLTANGGVQQLTVAAASTLSGSFQTITVRADAALSGSAQTATVCGGTLTVLPGAYLRTLTLESGACCNDGEIGVAEIYARDCTLGGSGSVESLLVCKPGFSTEIDPMLYAEQLDPGLGTPTFTRLDNGKPTLEQPEIAVQIRADGIPSAGEYPRTRKVEAAWYLNGALIGGSLETLSESLTLSRNVDCAALLAAYQESATLTLVLRYEGQTAKCDVTLDLSDAIRQEALTIRTQNVQAKIAYTAQVYGYCNGSSLQYPYGYSVKAGTQVTLIYTSKGYGAFIRMPDGRTGWVARSAASVIPGNYYTTQHYSTAAKEYYVNHIRNWSSNTGYLIWANLWTQEVSVFAGSKGNWKLVRADPCSSGANHCPTPVESVKILYKVKAWYYPEFYCHHVSVFDASRGFHSWPIKNGTTNVVYNNAMGWPNSGSCIRMMDEATTWIYDNIPVGTAVEIY